MRRRSLSLYLLWRCWLLARPTHDEAPLDPIYYVIAMMHADPFPVRSRVTPPCVVPPRPSRRDGCRPVPTTMRRPFPFPCPPHAKASNTSHHPVSPLLTKISSPSNVPCFDEHPVPPFPRSRSLPRPPRSPLWLAGAPSRHVSPIRHSPRRHRPSLIDTILASSIAPSPRRFHHRLVHSIIASSSMHASSPAS